MAYRQAYNRSAASKRLARAVVEKFDYGSIDWKIESRVQLAANEKVKAADDVPPELEDTRLQGLRCIWVLKYWMKASEQDCSGATIQGCDEA